MGDYIEVDGLRVGPNMVRQYLAELEALRERAEEAERKLAMAQASIQRFEGALLHNEPLDCVGEAGCKTDRRPDNPPG